MFVQSALETLPAEFDSIADEITANFPWGSLLRAVVLPEVGPLAKLAAIAKPGARIEMHINIHPFRDAAYAARLGLSEALLIANHEAFVLAYMRAGLAVTDIADVSDHPRATRWGKQLGHGSRRVLRVCTMRL